MAVMAENYGQGAVFGSLAYDFNNPELYREEYSTAQPQVRPREETRTRVRTRARTAVKTKQSIAPMSILGVLAACSKKEEAKTAEPETEGELVVYGS